MTLAEQDYRDTCLAAARIHFPDATDDERIGIICRHTAFGFVWPDDVVKQLKTHADKLKAKGAA